jgi:hypothetical protein
LSEQDKDDYAQKEIEAYEKGKEIVEKFGEAAKMRKWISWFKLDSTERKKKELLVQYKLKEETPAADGPPEDDQIVEK